MSPPAINVYRETCYSQKQSLELPILRSWAFFFNIQLE